MKALLELMGRYTGQNLMILFVTVLAVIVTSLLYWISNKNRWVKYAPAFVLLFIALYSLFRGAPRLMMDTGLESMWRFVLFAVSGFVSFCYALILGVVKNDRRLKRFNNKNESRKESS